jgi:hypothetical protein
LRVVQGRRVRLLHVIGDRNDNIRVVHARAGDGQIENWKSTQLLDDVKRKWNVAEVRVFVVVVIRFELRVAEDRIVDHHFDVLDELPSVEADLLDVIR